MIRNVISIMCDEMSGNLIHALANKDALTPNLDYLVKNGTTFTNAYTTCPVCVPARASWFTGQYVNRLGTWDNSTPYDGTVLGIAEHLKSYGIPFYQIGKTHFHHEGVYHFAGSSELGLLKVPDVGCYYRDDHVERIGAERRFKEIGISDGTPRFDDKVLNASLNWLDNSSSIKKPWVLNIGFTEPHFPFFVRQENWDYFDTYFKDIPLPNEVLSPYTSLNPALLELRNYFKGYLADEETIRNIRTGYYASVFELDEKIGLILEKMKSLGLDKDTAVIFTSDHGEQLGYHGLWWKCCMFEQSARIPFILHLPQSEGKLITAPISLTDYFPTICNLMNVPIPENLDGESLVNYCNDPNFKIKRDYAFSEFNAHGISGGMYMIRWKNYKYIFYTQTEPQLFDLDKDSLENHDLYKSFSSSEAGKNIIYECHKRLLEVCDPYEVTMRSKEFQAKMKKQLGLPEKYTIERGGNFVPHPEYYQKNK